MDIHLKKLFGAVGILQFLAKAASKARSSFMNKNFCCSKYIFKMFSNFPLL